MKVKKENSKGKNKCEKTVSCEWSCVLCKNRVIYGKRPVCKRLSWREITKAWLSQANGAKKCVEIFSIFSCLLVLCFYPPIGIFFISRIISNLVLQLYCSCSIAMQFMLLLISILKNTHKLSTVLYDFSHSGTGHSNTSESFFLLRIKKMFTE